MIREGWGSLVLDPMLRLSHTMMFIIPWLSVTICAAAALWIVARGWTALTRVPETKRMQSEVSRRSFVTLLIAAAGSAGVAWSWLKGPRSVVTLIQTKGFSSNPRFRKRKRRPRFLLSTLAPGFYLNPKSGIVHRVERNGRMYCGSGINERRLRPYHVLLKPELPIRTPLNCTSSTFEDAAIERLLIGDADGACALLAVATIAELRRHAASPSLRIFDLLAGLSVRFGKLHYRDKLIRTLNATLTRSAEHYVYDRSLHLKSDITSRIRRWKDPRSRFAKKWQAKGSVRWAGIPM